VTNEFRTTGSEFWEPQKNAGSLHKKDDFFQHSLVAFILKEILIIPTNGSFSLNIFCWKLQP
jgi:hypothetical protein